MHVIAPERYEAKPPRRKWPRWVAALAALLVIAGTVNYLRPLPAATASVRLNLPAATAVTLPWPQGGQQAVAADGYGLLATNGTQTPLATASMTKVILALCVLDKLPLEPGQPGPSFALDSHDVALYQDYADSGGSLLPVQAGETLTEFQMLEALLIPSANNIADSLAAKVFGGQSAYAEYAGSWLLKHGLAQTHIGSDASGFDVSTTSTASDMAQVGLLALQNPVLMAIAGQQTATFPIVGTVPTYDSVLGQNGITGLKTGNNDADPGAFLFTATLPVGSRQVRVSGTVMGAPNLYTALQDSSQLAGALKDAFTTLKLAAAGQAVGRLSTAWGASSPIITSSPLTLTRWNATPLTETHTLHPEVRRGEVGSMKVAAGQPETVSTLKLQHPVSSPSFWWRLTRR